MNKDTQELIADFIDLESAIAQLQENKSRVEQELRSRMEADGATAIPYPTHKVELKKTMAYDQSRLYALNELVDPDELVSEGAFIPAHEDTVRVPDKWNVTHLKKFAKYGDDVKAVIDGAAYVSKLTLSVKPKAVTA